MRYGEGCETVGNGGGDGINEMIWEEGEWGSTVMRFAVIQLNSASFFKFSTIPGNSYNQPIQE